MTRLQDDFYESVNGEWQSTAVIPNDKTSTGGFNDLADDIEKWLLSTTSDWLQGKNLPKNNPILDNFIKYHQLASDIETRNKIGTQPVKELIKQYKQYTSLADFASHIVTLEKAGLPNALPFEIAPDFKDARRNVLWAGGLSLILPDTTYYASDNEQGPQLLAAFRAEQEALLPKFGFTADEVADLLDKYLELDARVSQVVLSNEESSKYADLYHPYQWDDFAQLTPELPLTEMLEVLVGEKPDFVIVPEERFWQASAQFYTEAAWPLLRARLLVNLVNQFTEYLSEEVRVLGGAYVRVLTGLPEARSNQKAAFYLANGEFNQAVGLYYASQKFSSEAKADVETKVATMIDVYKSRLKAATWLAPETRDKAVVKLDTIVPHIGYPEKVPTRLAEKKVLSGETLFETATKFRKIEVAYQWSKWHQPVDRSEWHMGAHLVNAYYDPQQNQIIFPAAILQAPFYSLEQSSSANYGGIGSVIAHEISHAFDTNGASFDEFGSLNNWWTDADFAAFKERTQKIVDQFDGLDSYGAKVNGELTVSENVADLGGLAAALAAAKLEKDFSSESFFLSWATIWRMKARPEYMKLLASADVHGPAKLRVNVQVKNFDDFFETFKVTRKDGMWRDPENRVTIW
ncbi:M13-type metalloendopeptidase [Leuconostoc carnosum]|uniref:M13-type metalloendopeptidase n=1 Tax=Leuconostoc carnosum TaxID=1252 RepID=UPI00345DE1F4